MTNYEQYLLQLQSELPKQMYLTLDERLREHIELVSAEFDKSLMVDAHLEIIRLRKALLDMAMIAETDNWQDAKTGRQIILKEAINLLTVKR